MSTKDINELKKQVIERLEILDGQITEEAIERATEEELLEYLDLTEKLNALLKII